MKEGCQLDVVAYAYRMTPIHNKMQSLNATIHEDPQQVTNVILGFQACGRHRELLTKHSYLRSWLLEVVTMESITQALDTCWMSMRTWMFPRDDIQDKSAREYMLRLFQENRDFQRGVVHATAAREGFWAQLIALPEWRRFCSILSEIEGVIQAEEFTRLRARSIRLVRTDCLDDCG